MQLFVLTSPLITRYGRCFIVILTQVVIKTAMLKTPLDRRMWFCVSVAEKADSRDCILSWYSNNFILSREDHAGHLARLGLALCNTG